MIKIIKYIFIFIIVTYFIKIKINTINLEETKNFKFINRKGKI